MDDSSKKSKTNINPLYILDDIENVKDVLNDEELKIINNLFNSLDNFNLILYNLEKDVVKNNITINDLKIIFNSIIKLVEHRNIKKIKIDQKMGLTKAFFELPEIISRKILQIKNIYNNY
jgi:hypothetical protein